MSSVRAPATVILTLVAFALGPAALAAADPPNLTIEQPLASSSTNDQTPLFSGTSEDLLDLVTLRLYAGTSAEGPPVETLVSLLPPLLGQWSLAPLAPLEPGQYTAVAEQEAENAISAAVTFTVDTTAPVVSIDPVASPTTDAAPTLSGGTGTEAGDSATVAVTIYEGASVGGEVASSGGASVEGSSWSYTPGHLADGTYTAQATQADEAGNTGTSTTVTFTVDTTAPTVSVNALTSPTNNAAPTLNGAVGTSPGDTTTVTITIYRGASAGGEIASSGEAAIKGSAWSYTPSHLADGTYTAQATQADEAGNTGTSATVTFTVDTTAPTVSINALASPTNNAAPTLNGALGTTAGDTAAIAATIYKGASAGGEIVSSGAGAVKGATWSYTSSHLADGTYTARVTQKDEAGNTGTSNTVTFTVDTVAPALTIATPTEGAVLNVSLTKLSGLASQAGDALAKITLKIYAGASSAGSPVQTLEVTPSAGKWTTGSEGPVLTNGIYTVRAEQSDTAGNVGTSTVTFTVKTSSPVVTLDTGGFTKRASVLVGDATPSFSGSASTAPEDSKTVLVKIFSGSSTSGSPVSTIAGTLNGSKWKAGPVEPLADGTYIAFAEQEDSNPFSQAGVSASVTFTVDGHAPDVTLTSPADGSSTPSSSEPVGGAAGTAEGDSATIIIQLYAGIPTVGQTPLEAVAVKAAGAAWSSAFGGLSPGTYTARAEQSDDVGNIGRSAPATFTVTPPALPPTPVPPTPPVASFQWFPPTPRVGEAVSLVSTSTGADSPLTGFAWSLSSSGAFGAAGSTLTTSFSTPGAHVVRLLVTDANGLSNVATETITAISPAPTLMQPFPVVRIAGSAHASGIKISLLTVQAPIGTHVSVSCHGHGCPAKRHGTVSTTVRGKSKVGLALIAFRRFERSLGAGATLQIKVYASGQIGKYTRFTVRRGKLPLRLDTCLSTTGKAMACPS